MPSFTGKTRSRSSSSWAGAVCYHVTFHTDGGNALTLYMNGENYFALQEGDAGLLAWQADRFWKFIKEE